MKQIILTIDYELFLGEETGTVIECMIKPTDELAKILDYNNSKMTVFWDILHFYKLLEYEKKYIELKKDRIAIQRQIVNLVENGHDIQLHLHPHWLDAKFNKGKWKFTTYERFKLHKLNNKNQPDDINSIFGCIAISKQLIQNIVRKVDKDYEVFSFRAGGYLIEPFEEIKEAILRNGIYIDSSVCPEIKNESNVFPYNFKNYPKDIFYRFDTDISVKNEHGKFIEIPISSIMVPFYRRLYFALLKKLKYNDIEIIKKGIGSGSYTKKKQGIYSKIKAFVYDKKYHKLTTDNSFNEKYSYLINKAMNYSTQIIHPKMLNDHTLNLLKSKLNNNQIKFISIKDFVKDLKI